VIISRELIISGFRTIAADNGVVIAASYWGKIKTVCQMVMIIWLILDLPFQIYHIIGEVLIYVSLILTVISLIDYLVKNKDVLKESNN
jgi:CDP-diacylglycerol--glycerol-3-phosphate 3-phosphatidyltransferase